MSSDAERPVIEAVTRPRRGSDSGRSGGRRCHQTTTTEQPGDVDALDLTPDVAAAVSGFDGVTGAANGTIATLEGFVGTIAESEQAESAAAAVRGNHRRRQPAHRPGSRSTRCRWREANVGRSIGEMDGTSATIRGLVSTELEAAAAVDAAESVEGITAPVVNELRVLQPEVDAAVAALGVVEDGETVGGNRLHASDPVGRVVILTGNVIIRAERRGGEAAAGRSTASPRWTIASRSSARPTSTSPPISTSSST